MTDRRTKEAIRYLGYGKCAVDEKTLGYIQEAFEALERHAQKKFVYRIFECECMNEEEVRIGNLIIQSKRFSKNMTGCEHAIILAATLGIEVDRMQKRLSITDMTKAVILQAAAAAYLEEYINECQNNLKELFLGEGKYLRPRFSPGYGDSKITLQEDIIRMLDTAATIGLTRTERNMLVPTKSVTAFIGISKEKTDCHFRGCEICDKTDCVYRRC